MQPYAIGQNREMLLDAIEAAVSPYGIIVYKAPPAGLTPPAIVLTPADDWITSAGNFGDLQVHYEIQIISAATTGTEAITLWVDQLVAIVMVALDDTAWTVDRIGAPGLVTLNDSIYLACPISASAIL